MFQSVPQKGTAKPRLLATFPTWTFVTAQVVGPNTLYLSETDTSLLITDDSGLIEALQITQAVGIVQFWWKGDLWAAGSAAFKPVIIIPGQSVGSMSESFSLSGANS